MKRKEMKRRRELGQEQGVKIYGGGQGELKERNAEGVR